MQSYTPAEGTVASGKKKKDPNEPKKPLSAYNLYMRENRARAQEENPEAKFGDLAKIIARQFGALSPKEKAKYDAMAATDKDRYKRAMAAYAKKKQGGKSNADADSDGIDDAQVDDSDDDST
uniref:HMG box domain-containing protein n=1 Tax=Craspedostauros australis TaxID=1486917 RepID=A0A7R9ZNK2_9STRA|mmetsp:Transcript_24381/g.67916  ORF Transcript_24381/g.67916 Transcript_24381/m.67916 type:complete len:122 (+) Transcript_24381:222-587(+)